MKLSYVPSTDLADLQNELMVYDQDADLNSILLLVCDANDYEMDSFNSLLRQVSKTILGGIFPAIIYNAQKHEKGFIVAGLEILPMISTIENISSPEVDLDDEIFHLAGKYSSSKTMLIFIDGFAKRINEFIESIFTNFGLEFNYIGGGAGSLSLKQKPCIITNKGVRQDCAVVAGVEMNAGIGVKHGWNSIAGPYKVTNAEKTEVKELDFKPAFEVYKEVVEAHAGKEITPENFFDIAKAYPFGINKLDAEKVVRDPLFIGEENSLICVGELESGLFVDILTGDKHTLVSAASAAVAQAKENQHNTKENFIFFVDCISRVLFLEDDFSLLQLTFN